MRQNISALMRNLVASYRQTAFLVYLRTSRMKFDFDKTHVIRKLMFDEEVPPQRIRPRLKSAPKIRQLYWCDLPKDAHLPELWKRRPVVVLSRSTTLFGTVLVIPCSTKEQISPKTVFKLRTSIDERETWAICDKIMTVAVSRLLPTHGVIVRMPQDEFNEMLKVVLSHLPKIPED